MCQETRLADAIGHCRQDEAETLVKEMIAQDVPATQIVAACHRGMSDLGQRFDSGECFLPELMFAGHVMKGIMVELEPLLAQSQAAEAVGKVVLGSVQHDVHDIGKDIVVMTLRGVGFEVIDLGVNVPPQGFVDAIRLHRPSVVGLSLLLTTCFKTVEATTEAIRQAGLRDGLSIMVGGAAASDLLRINAGCDFYGKTAIDGVKFAGSLAAAQ